MKVNVTTNQPTGTLPTDGRRCDELQQVAMESAALNAAHVPTEIFIAPWGEVRTSSGTFVVDEEAATATIAAFESHGTDLPVDYEHQTLGGPYSSPTGEAPAAGWIKALSIVTPEQAAAEKPARQPGLWARVEWTSEAARKLSQRQYRYLSPVALVRRSDRRLIALHSVALTNKPAIVGMKPLVTSAAPIAPNAQGVAPASSRYDSPDNATAHLRAALHMDDAAPDEVLLVAAADRIALLEDREAQRVAEDRVAAAMSAGKLTAAQREWAIALALRDPVEFDRWEQAAPVLVPLGRLVPPRAGSTTTFDAARGIEAAARAEWHANRAFLEKLCTLEAYVASARRNTEP